MVGCVGVVGGWGVWLGVYESDWWGVCSEDTHHPTHPPDPHTDGTYAYGVDKYVVWCWLVGLAVCGVGG